MLQLGPINDISWTKWARKWDPFTLTDRIEQSGALYTRTDLQKLVSSTLHGMGVWNWGPSYTWTRLKRTPTHVGRFAQHWTPSNIMAIVSDTQIGWHEALPDAGLQIMFCSVNSLIEQRSSRNRCNSVLAKAQWNSVPTDTVQITAWTALLAQPYLLFKFRDCSIWPKTLFHLNLSG